MNLIRLPQKLQDYIILHELVHTKHKNHSKKFWAEMDRIVGDGKRLRKEMIENSSKCVIFYFLSHPDCWEIQSPDYPG